MAIHSYPTISEEDYPAFQKFMSDHLPERFAEWEFELDRKKGRERLEYEKAPGGSFASKDVPINHDLFRVYCLEKDEPPTIHMLYRYAAEYGG